MSGTDRHDQDTEKRCSRCNRVLSVTEFHRTVRHGVSTYRSACKKCRGEPMPQFIPDRSREAVEGRDDPAPKPPPRLYSMDDPDRPADPTPEPLPDPPPASSPAMPRYLREALKAEPKDSDRNHKDSVDDSARTREGVIRSLGEMDPDERLDELRVQRIYPGREPHT